jgi:hypothetical protein
VTDVVTLTPEQVELVKRIANERNDNKRSHDVRSRRFATAKSEFHIDYVGVAGEVAVSGLLNVPFDDAVFLGGDKGVDLILPTGHTVDVKTGAKRGYRFGLCGDGLAGLKADIGILCWRLSENEIEVVGWTHRKHLLEHHSVVDMGYGDSVVLEPHNMLPMERIIDYLAELETA